MAQTIVGLFDGFTEANAVVRDLVNNGISRESINITANDADSSSSSTAGKESIGQSISRTFRSLFGQDADQESGRYAEAVRRGNALVTVTTDDNMIDTATKIMNQHNAIDVDERIEQFRASGYTGYDANAPAYTAEEIEREHTAYRAANATAPTQNQVAIPVIEEELQVGKRVVQRGGVRIMSHVTERPVEETVQLREEHVNVERRPVNRPFEQADMAAFKEGVIEVTETSEEAVVSKQKRVVEEVVVSKEAVERSETISDTVRRTDVEVEQVDADRARNAKGTTR